jgi:uncharacterized repeat protein (TIGR03803 family)
MSSVHKVKRIDGRRGLAMLLLLVLISRAQGQRAVEEKQSSPLLQAAATGGEIGDGKRGCTANCYQATTQMGGSGGVGTYYTFHVSGDPKVKIGGGSGSGGNGKTGALPIGNLAKDSSGNVYSASHEGGAHDCGVVFMVGQEGYQDIYDFKCGSDGSLPLGGVIFNGGSLYGTTSEGGKFKEGTAFELSVQGGVWNKTSLYDFCSLPSCSDGATPSSSLLIYNGNLYGTTSIGGGMGCGGSGCGTVFELTLNGQETVLYSFQGGSDGANPQAGLIFDSAGNLYGTTSIGGGTGCGGSGCGTVFKVGPNGQETVLYSFQGGSDGANPLAGLVFDGAGNLFGTASEGGIAGPCSNPGCGTVFELSVDGGFSVVYSFQGGSADGAMPEATLSFKSSKKAGYFFGTTTVGGGSGCTNGFGCGTVFELAPPSKHNAAWTEYVLIKFTGDKGDTPGSFPHSNVALPN